jgi:Lipid A 3-O-deacylase (PagL)
MVCSVITIGKRRNTSADIGLALAACLTVLEANAEGSRLESIGARVGGSYTSNGRKFQEAEGFANFNLPWSWDLGRKYEAQTRLDLSLGWIGDPGGNGLIGHAEPGFLFSRERFPLSFELGAGFTGLSRHDFESKDFGIYFQFITHLGLNWEITDHFRLSYRLQHMSNGGLAVPNPGLNLHMLGLSYKF